jgi:hypothetical protein
VPKAKAAKEAADLEKAELTKLKDWYAYLLYICIICQGRG